MQRRRGILKSMVQCVGHKKSNVSQREGLSVPQRHAAAGPGHPSMHSAPYAVRPPSMAKTLSSVNFSEKNRTLITSASAMQRRISSKDVRKTQVRKLLTHKLNVALVTLQTVPTPFKNYP